jgi:uncharacterized protein (TIGR04376 family)
MGLFDDVSQFLEHRLEEFLKNNPHLELQALEESLRDQSEETIQLLADLKLREQYIQQTILATAQDVQRWHERVEKATSAGRLDLARLAQEREASLLREGNQQWGQMQRLQERIQQTKELQQQIQVRLQEVATTAAQVKANQGQVQAEQPWVSTAWKRGTYTKHPDPVDEQFRRWEAEAELEQMKRSSQP